MLIWIFNSTQEAKIWIGDNIPQTGDRIICLWSEQTSYEWNGFRWMNINGIHIIGEKGQDWLDWKNGKDGQPWKDWREWPRGQKWEQWERGDRGERWSDWQDYTPDFNKVIDALVEKLLANNNFITMVKGKNGLDGKDGIGIDGKDGEPWKPWADGIDWADGRTIKIVDGNTDIELFDRELGIDMNKNLYIKHNNSLLKI